MVEQDLLLLSIFFEVWQNTHNTFTISTIFKCTGRWIKDIHIILQPLPPSNSRTFFSPANMGPDTH